MPRRRLVALGALAVVAATGAAAFAAHRRSARIERSVTLARMGTKAGLGYTSMSVRSAFADEADRAALRTRFELETAEQVAAELGNMKGALMKLGQMASYVDQGLPEPVRDALSQLRTDAPPMAPGLVDTAIRTELGAPPNEVFGTFERYPVAAASIGQVHRAVTRGGADVAVKVQYPGVESAIEADLDNSDLLFSMMSVLFPGMDPGPIVSELRERLGEELDYHNEAAHQQMFADHYRGHPTIHVPDVHSDLSSAHVLTTDFVEGADWKEMLSWDRGQIDLAAETMYRFAFGGIYRLGVFNGDPHPGNYLFHGDGRVTFLDFGLTKVFTPDEVAQFGGLIDAMVLRGDIASFRRLTREIGILGDDDDRFSDDEVMAYFRHFYEFVLRDEEMTVTPEYASESVRRYFDLTSPHAELMKTANLPPSMVIIQRINLGLFALFGEMRARGNWRRIAEEIWPSTDAAPSTPMGRRIRRWETDTGRR